MHVALAVVSGLFFLLFVVAAFFNAVVICLGFPGGPRRRVSPVPLVGGLSGVVAFLIFPYWPLRAWAWLPPLLDIGCGVMVTAALADAAIRRVKKR